MFVFKYLILITFKVKKVSSHPHLYFLAQQFYLSQCLLDLANTIVIIDKIIIWNKKILEKDLIAKYPCNLPCNLLEDSIGLYTILVTLKLEWPDTFIVEPHKLDRVSGKNNNQFLHIQLQSTIQQRTPNYFENEIKQQEIQVNIGINHSCQCYGDNCDRQACPCYQYNEQLCIQGMCCVQCIIVNYYQHTFLQNILNVCTCKSIKCLKSYCFCFQNSNYCSSQCKCEDCTNKNNSLQRQAALQAMRNGPKSQTQIACTCKKTKCNKKYCRCYAGIKFRKICSCEGCLNCDKIEDYMEMDVENGFQYEQNSDVQMPAQIQFDPPQLPDY